MKSILDRMWLAKPIACNVFVETIDEGEDQFSTGSGVLISPEGTIITAAHVVRKAKLIRVTLPDRSLVVIDKHYIDPEHDVAFLDSMRSVDHFMPLSDSSVVVAGDKALHVGNVHGVYDDSILRGTVLRVNMHRLMFDKTTGCIMVHLGAKPGCSGGGVYVRGKLIGIVTHIFGEDAFVFPSNICKDILDACGLGE